MWIGCLGDHQCESCRVVLEPSRTSEGHVGVRFGDHPVVVLLDGVRVEKRCLEAVAGREGKVLLLANPIHRCPCDDDEHLCKAWVSGDVIVESVQVHAGSRL